MQQGSSTTIAFVGPARPQAARHVFALKLTTPACYHQFAVFSLFHDDVPSRDKARYMCCSFVLVWMQLLAVMAVASGVSAPMCAWSAAAPNENCADGQYCKVSDAGTAAARSGNWKGEPLHGFCSACLRSTGGYCRGAIRHRAGAAVRFSQSALREVRHRVCVTLPTPAPRPAWCRHAVLPGLGERLRRRQLAERDRG